MTFDPRNLSDAELLNYAEDRIGHLNAAWQQEILNRLNNHVYPPASTGMGVQGELFPLAHAA